MYTYIKIDPNVRVEGNKTYSGLEDVSFVGRMAEVGEPVIVYEAESPWFGEGVITRIDHRTSLVYLSVDWASLR